MNFRDGFWRRGGEEASMWRMSKWDCKIIGLEHDLGAHHPTLAFGMPC